MGKVLIAILGGLIGGVISPIVYDEYKTWRRERQWAAPRKNLLGEVLRRNPIRSLETLTRVTGMTPDDCRSMLIELGARGTQTKDGCEGWTLAPIGGLKPGAEAQSERRQ